MYVHVCVCLSMYVHVCACMCMYMYVYVCICRYMYVYVCICMYMYVFVYIYIYVIHICIYIYTYIKKIYAYVYYIPLLLLFLSIIQIFVGAIPIPWVKLRRHSFAGSPAQHASEAKEDTAKRGSAILRKRWKTSAIFHHENHGKPLNMVILMNLRIAIWLIDATKKHVRCNPDVAPRLTSSGYEDKVDVIIPINILFIGGGDF